MTGSLSTSVEVYFFTEKYAPSMMQKTQLICLGTGPWLYCWHIMEKGYNITGNETCDDPQIMKRTCEFPILWWASFICRADANVLLLSHLGVSRGRYALTVAHLHFAYPPTRQILPFDIWCKASPPTSLQRNNSRKDLWTMMWGIPLRLPGNSSRPQYQS